MVFWVFRRSSSSQRLLIPGHERALFVVERLIHHGVGSPVLFPRDMAKRNVREIHPGVPYLNEKRPEVFFFDLIFPGELLRDELGIHTHLDVHEPKFFATEQRPYFLEREEY